VVIDSHDGVGLNPQVSIGAKGEAVAVWVQSNLGAYKVWANRYVAPGGWEGDLLIGTTDGNAADLTKTSQPDVVVDANGAATAAWADYSDPVVRGLVSRRHTTPDGWGARSTIYHGVSTAGDARVAVDGLGNVMAVFSTGTGAWANYFQPALGWDGAQIIDNVPNAPIGVQVALEPDGNGWAAWSQGPPGSQNIFGNHFSPVSAWGGAARVEEGTLGNALDPQLAVDASGNALFVWKLTSSLRFQVWSNRWDASEGRFTDPVRLDSAGTAYAPVLASDPQGNGTAAWIQSAQVSGTPLQVAASRYTPGSGWSAPETLAEGDIQSDPRVAMDSQGNAVIAYVQKAPAETSPDAWAHTYSEGAWSPAVRLSLDPDDPDVCIVCPAFQPSVAMDPSGHAVAVWREGPDIWASTFE